MKYRGRIFIVGVISFILLTIGFVAISSLRAEGASTTKQSTNPLIEFVESVRTFFGKFGKQTPRLTRGEVILQVIPIYQTIDEKMRAVDNLLIVAGRTGEIAKLQCIQNASASMTALHNLIFQAKAELEVAIQNDDDRTMNLAFDRIKSGGKSLVEAEDAAEKCTNSSTSDTDMNKETLSKEFENVVGKEKINRIANIFEQISRFFKGIPDKIQNKPPPPQLPGLHEKK